MDLQALIDARIKSALDKVLDEMVSKGLARALSAVAEPEKPVGGQQLQLPGVPAPVVATMLPENNGQHHVERPKRRLIFPKNIEVRVNPNYRGYYPAYNSKEHKQWDTVTDYLGAKQMNRSQLAKDVAQLLEADPSVVSGTVSHMLRRGRLVLA